MPKTKAITIYEFSELPEEVQQKVLDRHREHATTDSFWYEHLTEVTKPGTNYRGHFQEEAKSKGFDLTEFYFRGFYSQGDGASFSASVDHEEYILKNKLGNKYRTLLNHVRREGFGSLTIEAGNSFYVHENTMRIGGLDRYFNASDDTKRAYKAADKAEEQALELAETILEHAQDLAHEFYKILKGEYEYITSDEQIKESIEANELFFTIDGRVV